MTLFFKGLFALIHGAAIATLIATLFSDRLRTAFERRCVGLASARDLAFVRIVISAALLLYVLDEDLPSYARLETTFYSFPGYMDHLRQSTCDWFFASASRLRAVSVALVLLLGSSLIGFCTRLALPLAAVVYLLYAALLRAPGKLFHEGYLGWYVLIVLAFTPAGDAWSVDAWRWARTSAPTAGGRDARIAAATPSSSYGWWVWACFAAAAIPYLQLAFSKLWKGGVFWFDGRSMRNYILIDDLHLTRWNIDLGLRFYQAPTLVFTALGFFGLLAELSYPLVLVLPRSRLLLAAAIMAVHLGVWLWQDALFVDAILVPAMFFIPSRWRARAS